MLPLFLWTTVRFLPSYSREIIYCSWKNYKFDLNIVFIPLHAFLTNGFNQSSIEVILDSVPSRHTNNELLRQISELLPDAVISDPFELIQADQSKNLEGIVLSSGVFLISILSFLSLFQYLVSENSYENAVYSIVGASNKSVIIITLLEIIILSSAAAFIACIVHVTCYDLLFVKINIYGSIRYSIYDYLVCFVLEILISFAAVLPFVCYSSTHSLSRWNDVFDNRRDLFEKDMSNFGVL